MVFWSLISAATALCHSFTALVVCRALGGLGEAFYFPAAMSLISDYHGPATRSRAMSLHQSSVYAGSIAGSTVSGWMGQYYGWRSSFLLFGGVGVLLGVTLCGLLREPLRGSSEGVVSGIATGPERRSGGSILGEIRESFASRLVMLLVVVFIAANFVAVVLLTWMPTFLYQKFDMSLAMAGWNATAFLQLASVPGALSGGLLAYLLRRRNRGGRILVQAIGLACGVPFLFLTGWTVRVPMLILVLIGVGYFKGLYDANIFSNLYEVVPVARRGAAAGILNSLGWLGGGFAPVLIAASASRFGLSACISATAAIYLTVSLLLFAGANSLS